MKISCLQMDMLPGQPDANYVKAASLIRLAAAEDTDVVMLPELWDVGFYPREGLKELADPNGTRVKREMGALAAELKLNIVAGSVAVLREDKVFNTAFVFNRQGECVAEYDKTHLFSPMGEHEYFSKGNHISRFKLDGVSCGLIICYDLRFPELTRSLSLQGTDILFVVSQWPDVRMHHLKTLCCARAIENQMFLCCCNSCGRTGETRYGGGSEIFDPWGGSLCSAGATEKIISAECDISTLAGIRNSINVFADRREELYDISVH